MPRTTADSFDEDPDEPGIYADDVFDDEPDVVICPYCGEEVSELAELCPHCKNYLSREDAPRPAKPRWLVVTAVLLIVCLLAGSLVVLTR